MHETFADYVRCKHAAFARITVWLAGGPGCGERKRQLRRYFKLKLGKAASPAGLYADSPLWDEVAGAIDAWLDPIPASAMADEWPIMQHVLMRAGE